MRGRGLLVVGALALLTLVLPAVALVAALGTDRPAPPPSDVDLAYAIDGELGCDTDVQQAPVLPLDAEPLAMLVCADGQGSLPWTAPVDLVEGDLSRLRTVLDGLEEAPVGDVECTLQAGPAYDLLLRFSRDRYARVQGDTGGCGFVTLASGRWFGAQDVLDAALALVEEHRDGARPPASPPALDMSCGELLRDQPATSLTGEAADLVDIVSCARSGAEGRGPWTQSRADKGDVRVLTRDIARTASPDLDPMDLRCVGGVGRYYSQHLIGRTAWGDLLWVPGECRRFFTDTTSERSPVWHPSPRSQRILDRLRR